MIFRTLVEHLIREPGDSLTVHSLTRELEQDLIAAFQISQPLVDAHPDIFWQSRSYLDFLIRISKLPSFKDYHEPQKTFKRSEPEDRLNQTLLDEEKCKNNQLQSSIDQLTKDLNSCDKELKKCQLRVKFLEDEKSKYETLQCEKEKLEQNSKSHEKDHEECDSLLKQERSRCDYLLRELQNVKSLLNEEQVKFAQLETERINLERKINNLELERGTLQDASPDNLQNKLYTSNLQTRRLGTEITKLTDNLKTCKHENDKLEKEIEETNEEYEKCQTELDEYRNKLTASEKELKKCNKNLRECRNDMKSLKSLCDQEIESIKRDCNATIQQIQSNFISRIKENNKRYEELVNFNTDLVAQHNKITADYQTFINQMQQEKIYSDQERQQLLKEHQSLERINKELFDRYHGLTSEDVCSEVEMKEDIDVKPFHIKAEIKHEEYEKPSDMNADAKSDTKRKVLQAPKISFSDDEEVMEVPRQSEDEKIIMNTIKAAYSTNDECENWQENARYHLPNDLELLKRIKGQLEKIKPAAERINVNPEDFAATVLELHQNAPKCIDYLKTIADAASITPLDESDTIEAVVPKVLERLKLITDLESIFSNIPYQKWSETLIFHLQNLLQYHPDLDEWIELQEECEKLAQHFLITLTPRTFYNDILTSQKLTECNLLQAECQRLAEHFQIDLKTNTFSRDIINSKMWTECASLKNYLVTYFKISHFSVESLRERIRQDLQMEEAGSEFQRDIQVYFIKVQNKMKDTYQKLIQEKEEQVQQDWISFSTQLGFTTNISRDTLAKDLITYRNECDNFYKECVSILRMSPETTKLDFLERLRGHMNAPKRSSDETNIEDDVKPRKASKPTENYTIIELQNFIDALYKEYFRMRWETFNDTYPKESEVIQQVKEKLEILKELKPNRPNNMVKIFSTYVKLDLEVFAGEKQLFSDLVSISDLLKASMKDTETYLENLMKKKTNEEKFGRDKDD